MTSDRLVLAGGGTLGGIGGIWAAVHTAAPEGIQFSAGALAITAILLALLVSAILGLFGLLLAAQQAQIAELRRLAFRATDTTDKALHEAQKAREGP